MAQPIIFTICNSNNPIDMKVFVNGQKTEVNAGSSLQDLCRQIGIGEKEPVAVAIGTDVIERDNWASIQLNENDNITIIRATCGG